MEQLNPTPEQEPPVDITEVQVQLAREIANTTFDSQLHTTIAAEFLYEQATAFGNRPVAEALWQEVPLTFDNLSRWYDVNPDPALLPRLYERLVSEELPKVDNDYIDDQERRRMSQHDRAATRVAVMMAEANEWGAVPPLLDKVYYKHNMLRALTNVAIEQGNKERMIELIRFEAGSTVPSPWGRIIGSVSGEKAARNLAKVGISEFEGFAQNIEGYQEVIRNASFNELLEKGYATIALASFMGEPLAADQERDQTNWSRAFDSLGSDLEKFLVSLNKQGADFSPYVEPMVRLYIDTNSWEAIRIGLYRFRAKYNGMGLPDDVFYQAFTSKMLEALADTEFAARANELHQKYIDDQAKYPRRNGVIERLWDPQKMVIDEGSSVRSHYSYELETSVHDMKGMTTEEVMAIQDPTARANGLLALVLHEGKTELAVEANEAISAIFDPKQRFIRQYLLLHHTI